MNRLNLKNAFSVITVFSVVLSLLLTGCQSGDEQTQAPIPRPVSYVELKKIDPIHQSFVAGSVVAWKKEPVGFDVNGRVQFVQEPLEGTRPPQAELPRVDWGTADGEASWKIKTGRTKKPPMALIRDCSGQMRAHSPTA